MVTTLRSKFSGFRVGFVADRNSQTAFKDLTLQAKEIVSDIGSVTAALNDIIPNYADKRKGIDATTLQGKKQSDFAIALHDHARLYGDSLLPTPYIARYNNIPIASGNTLLTIYDDITLLSSSYVFLQDRLIMAPSGSGTGMLQFNSDTSTAPVISSIYNSLAHRPVFRLFISSQTYANGNDIAVWKQGLNYYSGKTTRIAFLNEASSTSDRGVLDLSMFCVSSTSAFTGTIRHANTVARIWDYPDNDGTIALISDLSSFVISGGALGTPSSGNLVNCTFPTLNQNTTGSANSLKSPSTTGLAQFTGMGAATTRVKTVRDANDTILELGGSYTPTGTWTNMKFIAPDLGTPISGTLTNCSGLPITSLEPGTSANLASVISDETGTGVLVFGTIPTLTTAQKYSGAAPEYSIIADTSDGSDTRMLRLCGGGSAQSSRGAYIDIGGNEHSTRLGRIDIIAGDVASTGTIDLYTANSPRIHLSYSGSVVVGSQSALATNATEGFLYIPTSAGAPTGTPTAYTGKVALEYDKTNNNLYIYNGAWKKVAMT